MTPAHTNEQFPRGVEVVGSAIVEDADGKILLVRQPKWHNKWTMAGGHIEPGETIAAALIREAKEEVGLDLTFQRVITFGELINSQDFARPAHFIYFNILCTTTEKNVVLDSRELSEYVWVTPEEALTMDLAESYDRTIREYMEFKKTGRS